jgi:hypothetical protein
MPCFHGDHHLITNRELALLGNINLGNAEQFRQDSSSPICDIITSFRPVVHLQSL